METKKRKRNLIFLNVLEKEGERNENQITKDTVAELFGNHLKISNVFFEKCLRIGKNKEINPRPHSTGGNKNNSNEKPRNILVQFGTEKDRNEVWGHRRELKGIKVILKEDFPSEID